MNKFCKRIYYRLLIKPVSPVSVGFGENEGTDHDIIADASGKPFIPATAIAGVLRHSLDDAAAKTLFGCVATSKGENASVPARVLPWNIRSGDTFRVRYDGMSGIHPKFFVIR